MTDRLECDPPSVAERLLDRFTIMDFEKSIRRTKYQDEAQTLLMRWTEAQAQLLLATPEPIEGLLGLHMPAVYAWWDLSASLDRFYPQGFPPVDHRQPIYVGSAESDVGQRFSKYHRRRIGGSSPRFSLASILVSELQLLPGSSIRVGKAKLDRVAEARLTAWIGEHLLFTSVELNDAAQALYVEDRIIKHLLPPLNINKANCSPYRDLLAVQRATLRRAIAASHQDDSLR